MLTAIIIVIALIVLAALIYMKVNFNRKIEKEEAERKEKNDAEQQKKTEEYTAHMPEDDKLAIPKGFITNRGHGNSVALAAERKCLRICCALIYLNML